MAVKPEVKKDKYIVDVCYGGVYALFPDGTVRPFRSIEETEAAIREDCRRKVNSKAIHTAVIEWNARDREIIESVEWRNKSRDPQGGSR